MRLVTGLADRVLNRLVPRTAAKAGTGALECYRVRCGAALTCWDVCCRVVGGDAWDCRGCPCDD